MALELPLTQNTMSSNVVEGHAVPPNIYGGNVISPNNISKGDSDRVAFPQIDLK